MRLISESTAWRKTLQHVYIMWIWSRDSVLTIYSRTPANEMKSTFGFMRALSYMPQTHMVTHRKVHRKTSTHLTHYFNVGDSPRSSFASLIGQDRQDKITGFGQRLSHQEGVRFISCHKELLCISPRQVTMEPPETKGHWRFMMQPLCYILIMHWAKSGFRIC